LLMLFRNEKWNTREFWWEILVSEKSC
jgi:hypothetical protein